MTYELDFSVGSRPTVPSLVQGFGPSQAALSHVMSRARTGSRDPRKDPLRQNPEESRQSCRDSFT